MDRWPPRLWPLWLFWAGILVGTVWWAFGVAGAGVALAVCVLIAFAVANDWLG